ncbi:hypothetical protein SteCoe_8355 [Stentor coeruleus]|uniref:Uncharacterized protein n=1 Tax=Stentor coeruleus TaxID=5963 RepID=A0A1R2CKA2_9CILI|nr:hypothetical protein SteCoe_8355 [Stentor coeruleus]
MDADSDSFLKVLQKRQRNLAKKLDRIKKKQSELRSASKEIKEEEKKMLESVPQIQELLVETEKLTQQYQKHLESTGKYHKIPQKNLEDDRSKEILSLWILGEFLCNPSIKEHFQRENPNEQDFEAFLTFHSQAKGQTGNTLAEISDSLAKSLDLYLAKSDKIAQGTMRTYKKLSEFTARGLAWASNHIRPLTPVKNDPIVYIETKFNTHNTQIVEKKHEVEEIKTQGKKENKQEKIPESNLDDKEDNWGEKNQEKGMDDVKGNEGDGFTEVKSKKDKKVYKPKEEENERIPRGRGRRGERRGGRRGNKEEIG